MICNAYFYGFMIVLISNINISCQNGNKKIQFQYCKQSTKKKSFSITIQMRFIRNANF